MSAYRATCRYWSCWTSQGLFTSVLGSPSGHPHDHKHSNDNLPAVPPPQYWSSTSSTTCHIDTWHNDKDNNNDGKGDSKIPFSASSLVHTTAVVLGTTRRISTKHHWLFRCCCNLPNMDPLSKQWQYESGWNQ